MKTLLNLDKSILFSVFHRFWLIINGLIMFLIIPFWLNPREQGFFYLFYSIIGLQVFFELGLNQIVLQRLSASFSNLKIEKNSQLSGSEESIKHFSSILECSKKWYLIIALCFYLIALMIGFYMIFEEVGMEQLDLYFVTIALLLFVAMNIKLSVELTALQAIGKVAEVAKLRTMQSMFGCFVLILAVFIFKIGLAAIFCLSGISSIFTFMWLRIHSVTYLHPPRQLKKVSWRKEFFPLQWKMAFSWVSGYILSQIMIPIVFKHYGSIEAGKLGMTMSAYTAIVGLGVTITSAKIPEIARLISVNKHSEAFLLFKSTLVMALILNIFIVIAFLASNILLSSTVNFFSRLTSFKLSLSLAAVAIANTFISSASAYLRAHNREPMLMLSCSLAFLSTINLLLIGERTLDEVINMYAEIIFFIGIPWTLYLLVRNKKNVKVYQYK